jgi:CheY-like chemotaxis protein
VEHFESVAELKELNDENLCKNYWIDLEKVKPSIIDALANLDKSKLVVIANITNRSKLEEMGILPDNIIFKPVTLTKLKNVLNRTISSTPQLVDETLPTRETKFDAKVLVTEDNIINQKLIKRILEEHGMTVDLANNGLECFEKRRSNDYDLLFMDIQMPVMDGIEATHEILDYEEDEDVPHVPIVALTANALKGDRQRFLGEGMDEYITKPIETSELLYVLNKFLSDKASTRTISKESPKTGSEEPLQDTAAPVEETPAPIEAEVAAPTPSGQKILIAKKLLLEKRVLSKVIKNLGYDFDTLDDVGQLEERLASGSYDILFSDEDLVTASISQNYANLAIITSENSKEEIENLIKKYRG